MHHNHNLNLARLWIALLAVSTTVVHCKTASQDGIQKLCDSLHCIVLILVLNFAVSALNVMYTSLNSPSKLSGWKSSGGVPCGDSWEGIKCSGSSVTEIDLSNNNQKGDIPYRLPPNARYINLAHNQLKNQLGDMFGKLSNLKQLHLQNNQFTGSVNVLANLPLEDLNVENNKFTGWVPKELKDINSLQTGGNSWSSGPAPPPPPGTPPIKHSEKKNDKSVISGVAIAGIAFGVLAVIIIVVALSKRSSKPASHFIDEERRSQHRSFTTLASEELSKDSDADFSKDYKGFKSMDSTSIDVKASQNSPSIGVRSSVSDCVQSFNDNEFANRLNSRRSSSIRVTTFTQAELQSATANFASGRLLGEGSIGCVYRAKYADGKRTSQNLGAGYNAPECAKPSAYTQKSDVYSFGVVMLSKPKAAQCLVRWATPQLHDINAVEKMADPALRGLYPPKSLFRFADIIALCSV
ncbi:hypothetical protein JHK82_017129 [Glycine max]|nr:hypothetical protein JHK82_017129 [Glycine max]